MKRLLSITGLLLALSVRMGAYEVTVDNFSITPGEEKSLNVYLTNEGDVSAFQFDIYLPEGVSVVKTPVYNEDDEEWVDEWGVNAGRMKSDHTINAHDNGTYYTFLLHSGSSKTLKGTSGGAVFTFKVAASDAVATGIHTVDIKNVRYSNPQGGGDILSDQTCQCTIAINVTIGASGYATYSWPRALDFAETGLEAYIAKGDFMTNGEIEMTAVTKVPANTGLVLKGAEGTYHPKTTEPAGTDDVTGNQLVSTAAAELDVTTDGIFALGKKSGTVGFYMVNSANGLKIPQYRAYLNGSGSASSREFIGFGDATGIGEGVRLNDSRNETVYDLQGRHVAKESRRGLYVTKGRKLIVK